MPDNAEPRAEVRQLQPDEWRLLRDLRLRALTDAPDAFEAKVETARAFPDEEWRRRAEGWRTVDDVVFVCDGDGMVVGVRDGEEALLGAMWVDPKQRGAGVGLALADAVINWARSWGANRVRLGVADGNRPATRLYERLGFVETGRRELLRNDLVEVEYLLELHDHHT